MDERVLPVFVYGYLKRGGPGHHLVAESLEDVVPAIARGSRVATGADYPGVVFGPEGEEITGELLYIRAADFQEAIKTLDAYEQTEAPDLYKRVTTTVSSNDEAIEAYVYEFTGPIR